MAKQLTHQHNIRVETEEENVTVTIGGDGGIPGGFAKFFNRVVDSLAWARLSDAGRAAYLPLVRFADQRNHFRVRVGQASLMKYSGLSRSSIKRAMKDLLSSKLLVLIEQGGVTPDGQNEANLYQLMVPVPPRGQSNVEPPAGPLADPHPAPFRTPTRFTADPPVVPPPAPPSGRPPTGRGADARPGPGSARGPLLRSIVPDIKESSTRKARGEARPSTAAGEAGYEPSCGVEDAAALLEEKGVAPGAARELAAAHPYERVVDVVATMEYRKARGRCDNPGGFIREALVKQWQTPRAVTDARRRAEARLRQEAADRDARQARLVEDARAGDEDQRVERLIDSLDDEELAILAESVLKKHEGNSAVLQVLTRRPPRECRLMKMEVAAMLRSGR